MTANVLLADRCKLHRSVEKLDKSFLIEPNDGNEKLLRDFYLREMARLARQER